MYVKSQQICDRALFHKDNKYFKSFQEPNEMLTTLRNRSFYYFFSNPVRGHQDANAKRLLSLLQFRLLERESYI